VVGRPALHKGPVAKARGRGKTLAGAAVSPKLTEGKVTAAGIVIAMLREDAGVRGQQTRVCHIPVGRRDQLAFVIALAC